MAYPYDDIPLLDAEALGLSGILGNAINIMHKNQAAMFGQLQQQNQANIGARDQAYGDYSAAMQTPTPQPNANAEAYSRLAGGISQALAPQMGGQQMAESAIGDERLKLQQQQLNVQKILAEKYQRAAMIADKSGDLETSLKMWKSHQGALGLIDTANKNLMNMQDNNTRLLVAQQQAREAASRQQADHVGRQFTAAMNQADSLDKQATDMLIAIRGDKNLDKKKAASLSRVALAQKAHAREVRDAANKFATAGKWGEMPKSRVAPFLAQDLVSDIPIDEPWEVTRNDLYTSPAMQQLLAEMNVTPEELEGPLQQLLAARMQSSSGPRQAPPAFDFEREGLVGGIGQVAGGAAEAIGTGLLPAQQFFLGTQSMSDEDRMRAAMFGSKFGGPGTQQLPFPETPFPPFFVGPHGPPLRY